MAAAGADFGGGMLLLPVDIEQAESFVRAWEVDNWSTRCWVLVVDGFDSSVGTSKLERKKRRV
jgi:hypothetical protein